MKGIQNTVPATGISSPSNTSYVPILQGILDGIGWKNPSIAINEAQKSETERQLSFQEIEGLYKQNPDEPHRQRLLAAIEVEIAAAKAELRSAKRLQKEAHDVLMKKTPVNNMASRLGSWLMENIQYAFDSTPEQLIKRYSSIAKDRKDQIKKLSRYRNKIVSSTNTSQDSSYLISQPPTCYPSMFNLSNLTDSFGLTATIPEINYSWIGKSVSNLGDINADGIDDIVINSNKNYAQYVVFGQIKFDSEKLDLSKLDGMTGFFLKISLGSNNGFPIISSDAGDVNADGIDDMITACPYLTTENAGIVYITFGSTAIGRSGSLELSSLNGSNGFIIRGINDNNFTGSAINRAGDINGDGVEDILIGAPYSNPLGRKNAGMVYVIFGKSGISSNGTFELTGLNGTNGFIIYGKNTGDLIGDQGTIDRTGDVNQDGIDDIILSSHSTIDQSNGTAFIVYGASNIGLNGLLDLMNLNTKTGLIITWPLSYLDPSESVVSYLGDINADGINDLLIGDELASTSGSTFVIFGNSTMGVNGTFQLSGLNGKNGFVLQGAVWDSSFCRSGGSVSNLGDFNNDGFDDLLVGTNMNFMTVGYAYIVFGGISVGSKGPISLPDLNGNNGFILRGITVDDYTGSSVSGAGDVNFDGINDLIIGAPGINNNTGGSYIVFGGKSLANCTSPTPPPTPSPTPTPTPTAPASNQLQQNIIIISAATSASLFTLALIYCVYKYRKKYSKKNLTDQKSLNPSSTQPWPQSDEVVTDTETLTAPTTDTSSVVSYQSLPAEPAVIPDPIFSQNSTQSVVISSSAVELKSSISNKTPGLDESGEIKVSFGVKFAELKYNEKDKLGQGAYGTVYKGTYNYNDVAIKKLHSTHLSSTALNEFKKEVAIMGKMRSDYVTPLMGVCLEAPNYCLVMKWMPRGSLHDFLQTSPNLPQAAIYRIALDVTYGLLHLHQANIIHRDLKTLNVLLDGESRARVTDFGLSKIKSETSSSSSTKKISGTLAWMAPELFDEKASATQAADIYALGMVLWALIIKPYTTPFKGLAINALIAAKISRGPEQEKIPTTCPSEYAKLIRSCWKKSNQRPDAKKIADNLYILFSSAQGPQSSPPPNLVASSSTVSVIPSYISNPLSSVT
jgi:tRNA A-37 threonylcarbamoyl transferase component Bud32